MDGQPGRDCSRPGPETARALPVRAYWPWQCSRCASWGSSRASSGRAANGRSRGGRLAGWCTSLSDSAAQGVGASSPDAGYVGLLAEQLRESTGRPVQVVNLASRVLRVADVVDRQLPRPRDSTRTW